MNSDILGHQFGPGIVTCHACGNSIPHPESAYQTHDKKALCFT